MIIHRLFCQMNIEKLSLNQMRLRAPFTTIYSAAEAKNLFHVEIQCHLSLFTSPCQKNSISPFTKKNKERKLETPLR